MDFLRNNKIKLLLIFFLIIKISFFCNGAVKDLKFKKEDVFRRFYLIDEAGKANYGFFEFNSNDPDNLLSVKDTTSDQYKGLSNLTLVGNLFDYQKKRFINTIAMSSTYGLFAATTGAGSVLLALGLISETIDDSSRAMLIAGGTLLFLSSVELIVGSIFLGRFIYFIVNYNKSKKEILKELNKSDTSLIKLKNVNIRFSLKIT